MKLRFSESEIVLWAKKYYCPPEEDSLLSLKPEILATGYITKEQLMLIAHWKAPRSAGHVEKNDASYVKEITSWAFSAKDQRSKIEVLTLLDGVQWPSASVILHIFHNAPYPILDFRALWSVGLEVPGQYSFPFWWEYTEFCRLIAQRNVLDMRTLDRALWQYSKENQNV